MITDPEGVQFLQWCLPRLRLRWLGFRKVRRQIYKRMSRRLQELGLSGVAAYRTYLEDHPGEWATLDRLCWISISRFYRDQGVFRNLEREILPELARATISRREDKLHCWSAGCAGGEEPYTLAILWQQTLAKRFPTLCLQITATDIDARAIQRAERACYRVSSLKELPAEWRKQAFVASGEEVCLKARYRAALSFRVQDIRETMPRGPFHLILCRNLVFTYFDETSQQEILAKLTDRLLPGGALIIGKLESLPEGHWVIEPWSLPVRAYRKPLVQN